MNIKIEFIIFFIFLIAIQVLSTEAELLSINDLYELALENSSLLVEKTAKEKAALFRVMEAKSKGAPVFNFESTLSHIHNPETLTVEAGAFGTVPVTMPAEDTTFTMSGNNYYDFKLIIDQPIFTWGKIYNSLQAVKEGAAAANIDSSKTRDRLKTEILINTSSLYHLQKIKKAVEIQKINALKLENISKNSFENGMILQTEYFDAQVKRKESELAGNIIEKEINQLLLNLIYITGVELKEEMILSEDFSIPQLDSWEQLYSKTLEGNSDLLMLRNIISAEEYKNKIQKGNYYLKPDLAFHMEISYSGSYSPFIQEGWLDEYSGNLTMTVGIKTPIADFGSMYAAAKASDEDLTAKRASLEYTREQLEKFIRKTVYEMELNQLNIKFYMERVETDLKMMNQKKEELDSGYGNESDFLLYQINYYSNIILLNKEFINLKTNYFTLQNICGNHP